MNKIIFCSDFTPVPGVDNKLHADGKIANALLEEGGWTIDWLRTNFSHYEKKRVRKNKSKNNQINVKEFYGISYKKNISIARLIHNIIFSIQCFIYVILSRRVTSVVTPVPSLELSYLIAIACKIKNIDHYVLIYDKWPDIFIEYNSDAGDKIGRVLYKIYSPMLSYALDYSSHVFAVSEDYKQWAISKSNIIKCTVMYIGVNEINHEKIIESNKSLLNIVYVGSWGASYDIESIIKAAEILINEPVKFIVAGRTMYDKNYKKNSSNLTILGWLNEQEKEKLMLNADICLMPYKRNALQSLPNKIFEYLEYGCSIVSTLKGEAEVLIYECNAGVTVDSESANDLAEGIKKCIKSMQAKKTTSKIAQEKFGKQFYKNVIRKMNDKTNNA